jgi:hypothetical protein
VKLLPEDGVAVRITAVPLARLAEQVPEVVPAALVQLRPPMLPVMTPEPIPLALTVSKEELGLMTYELRCPPSWEK